MSNKVLRRVLIILLTFMCIVNMIFCFLFSLNSIKKVYLNESNINKIQELLAKDFPLEDINNISAIGYRSAWHNSIIYIYNLSNDFQSISINDNNSIGRYVQENGESIDKPLVDTLSTITIAIIIVIIIIEFVTVLKKVKHKEKSKKDNLKELKGIRKIFAIVKTKIIFYVFIYVLFYVVTTILLHKFNLEYMQWVHFMSSLIILIGGMAGIIQLLKKEDISVIMIIVLDLLLILIFIVGIYLVFKSLNYEEISYKDGYKMVENSFSDSYKDYHIDYYDYKNIFVRGKNARIRDIYHRSFSEDNYIVTDYYDRYGNYLYSKNKYEVKNTDILSNLTGVPHENEKDNKLIESIKQEDILYEKELNKKTKIQIISRGAILGQKILVVVGKTVDGGQTWYNQLEMYDGALTVNNDSKYVFINQNIGFINNLQTVLNDETQQGLLVTVDGGKTFEIAQFENIEEIGTQYLYVEDVPYVENQILKVKTYTIDYNREKTKIYYEFYSKDFGKTWEYVK